MVNQVQTLWRVACHAPLEAVSVLADAIGGVDGVVALSTFEVDEAAGRWLIEATSQGRPDRRELVARVAVAAVGAGVEEPELDLAPLPALNWVDHSLASFTPIRAGRFFVHGSHFTGQPPVSSIPLVIDAGTAFGSGEHASTKGCLVAIDRVLRRLDRPRRAVPGPAGFRRHQRMLDVGCGSGILAMAVAASWRVPVVAVDIDPESVRVAGDNARRNRLGGVMRVGGSDGYMGALVRRSRPYLLIAANILARPLARMAPALKRALAPGGTAILSGLLVRQERLVLAAHRAQRLRLVDRVTIEGWRTLVLRRGSATSGYQRR